jgi:hypothetical protein
MSAVWWSESRLVGYLGRASHDGLEWRRHQPFCKPGLWAVQVTGWTIAADAVIDDFGNLVQVRA